MCIDDQVILRFELFPLSIVLFCPKTRDDVDMHWNIPVYFRMNFLMSKYFFSQILKVKVKLEIFALSRCSELTEIKQKIKKDFKTYLIKNLTVQDKEKCQNNYIISEFNECSWLKMKKIKAFFQHADTQWERWFKNIWQKFVIQMRFWNNKITDSVNFYSVPWGVFLQRDHWNICWIFFSLTLFDHANIDNGCLKPYNAFNCTSEPLKQLRIEFTLLVSVFFKFSIISAII